MKISELSPAETVERELLLATIKAPADTRAQVVELVDIFEGRILDVGLDSLTVALEGAPAKVDDFEELLRPFGIVELQRTGRVALRRLEKTGGRLRPVRDRAS